MAETKPKAGDDTKKAEASTIPQVGEVLTAEAFAALREQIVNEPYWLPSNSGASNPSLPTRRFFKPRPTVICEHLVIRGCNEAVVLNDCLESFADGPSMGHEILTVPHFVVKCYIFNWNLATVGQHQRAARKAILLSSLRADAQAAPEQLDVLGQALAKGPGHDDARHIGNIEPA